MGCEYKTGSGLPLTLELRERLGQGDGVPARRHREIVTGVFAFGADAPPEPPRRGMEEQQ